MKLYKSLIYLLTLIIWYGCINGPEQKISEEFKIEFLKQILSDTINGIIDSKEQLIVITPLEPFYQPNQASSYAEFISDSLELNDTSFVKRQMDSNDSFAYRKLKNYGFRLLDLEQYRNDTISIYDISENLNKGYKSFYVVRIGMPVFNKKLDKAYLTISDTGGRAIIYQKIGNKWFVHSEFNHEVF